MILHQQPPNPDECIKQEEGCCKTCIFFKSCREYYEKSMKKYQPTEKTEIFFGNPFEDESYSPQTN